LQPAVGVPASAVGLDQMTQRGPCQPLPFCDSVIYTKSRKHVTVLYFISVQRRASDRRSSPKRGRKGLSGFKTSWAQLMSDFCLTMASLCFPSKQYMDRWALCPSKHSRRHRITSERTDFPHSSLAGRSCLSNNSGEKCNWKPQKNFSVVFVWLVGFFLLKRCFQGICLTRRAQLYSVHFPAVTVSMC